MFSSRTPEQARIGIPTLGESVDSLTHPPAIVIYMVDPFLCSSGVGDGGAGSPEDEGEEVEPGSIWLLGLLRCYTEMLKLLPETIRPALVLQVHTGTNWLFTGPPETIRPALVLQVHAGTNRLFTGPPETIRPALVLQVHTGYSLVHSTTCL